MGALRLLFGRKHVEAKVKAFRSVVYPVMAYCGAVWIPWQKTFLARLSEIQREFATEVGLQDLTEADFMKRTKIMPMERLQQQRRLILMYKISRGIYPGSDAILQAVDSKNRTRHDELTVGRRSEDADKILSQIM